MAWANAGGIPGPSGLYRGSDPFGSMVHAFSDPATDSASRFYFYGGGHGDGTCNAVVRLDPSNFEYTLVGQPTPPSVYLPQYLQTTTPLNYPSGVPFAGWFLTADELADPVDAQFRAPRLARVSTHMYAAAAMRGSVIHYFYLTYGEFDVGTGTWSGRGVDLGQQLPPFRTQYGSVALQQGTGALYDEVTDRFLVTLVPGDSGGGWRNGLMLFNPTTRQLENIFEISPAMGGPTQSSMNLVRVGREVFVFTKLGNYGEPQIMHQGFTFNLDTHAIKRFSLDGDVRDSTFPFSSVQETIPSYTDGIAIRRWNFSPAQRNTLLSVDPHAVGGTGSETDPLIYRQTARSVAGRFTGESGYEVLFVYSRLIWDARSGCALVLPRAESDWYALRLSP